MNILWESLHQGVTVVKVWQRIFKMFSPKNSPHTCRLSAASVKKEELEKNDVKLLWFVGQKKKKKNRHQRRNKNFKRIPTGAVLAVDSRGRRSRCGRFFSFLLFKKVLQCSSFFSSSTFCANTSFSYTDKQACWPQTMQR